MKIFATLFLLLFASNLTAQNKRIDQFVLTNTFGGADYFLFEKMNTNAYYSIRGSNLVSSITGGFTNLTIGNMLVANIGQFLSLYTTNLVVANLAASNQVVYVDEFGQLWATTGGQEGDFMIRSNGVPMWESNVFLDLGSLTDPIPMNIGGSGSVLLDPNANAVWLWDDAQGSNRFASIGSGLAYSAGVLSSTGGGGGNQTPWTNNINGAGYFLTNGGGITVTGIAKIGHLQIGSSNVFDNQDISIYKNASLPEEVSPAWINIGQTDQDFGSYTKAAEWWTYTETNHCEMAQAWLSATNGVQDGTNRSSYWSTGPTQLSFYWKMRENNRDVLSFYPSQSDTPTPNYIFDTALTRVGGNLLEVKNNTTNKFSVAWDGTVTAGGVVLGAGGSGGSGTNSMFEYSISNTAAIGDTSVALDRDFVPPATKAGHIAIGFGTTNCEVRSVQTVAGNTVTFGLDVNDGSLRPLIFAHAAGERVVWFTGDAYAAFWNMKSDYAGGNGTDNSWAMLNALWDTSSQGIRLIGNGSFGISMPMVLGKSSQVQDILVAALNIYTANVNTNSWFFINQQAGRFTFSVSGATNTIITSTVGTWPVAASNMMVVPYGIGGTNLPTGLTNGIPVFVKAWDTNWLRVGLTEDATNELTLGTGTGFLYTEVGGQHKIYLDNVTLDGGIKAGINGLYACVQQPAQTRYLRLNSFLGTALKLPVGVQQVDINNLQIATCGLGLDTLGASFVYIKSLNIEAYTNGVRGGAHIWGMHLESPRTTNGHAIDLTHETAADLMIDGFSSSIDAGLTEGESGFVHLLLSDADSNPSVDLRRLTFPQAITDGGMIAISDPRYGPDIHVENTTNGLSCHRFMPRYQHGVQPAAEGNIVNFGGYTYPGYNGRLVQFGSQNPDQPTMRLRSMTNQIANALDVLRSDGTTNSGFRADGKFFQKTNASNGFVLTSDANGVGSWAAGGGAGSQTPWLQDIDGGGFTLTNAILGTATQPIADFYPQFIRGNPYGNLGTHTNLPLNPAQFDGFATTNHNIKAGATLTNLLVYGGNSRPALGLQGHASSAKTFTITNGVGTEVFYVTYNGSLNIHGAASGATMSEVMLQVTPNGSNSVAVKLYAADPSLGIYTANVLETYTTNGSTLGFSVDGVGNAYVAGDISALTITDRSESPDTLEDAFRMVSSIETVDGKVNHNKLDPLLWGKKQALPDQEKRNLSMLVSAQALVIKDLVRRIELLEDK